MTTQTVVEDSAGKPSVGSQESINHNWRVAVDNIGNAGIALVAALKNGLKIGQQEIARRLLHAPSVLAEDLSADAAKQIADYLNEIGLEARALSVNDEFEPGVGGYEIAVVDMDFRQVSALLKLLVELTGIAPDDAIKLLSKSPAVILANISKANAITLQQRFAAVGAQLAISEIAAATYDVLLIGKNHIAQRELTQLIKTLQLPNTGKGQSEAIAIQELNFEQAQKLWQAAQERKINCKLLNRAYQRYDVRLEKIHQEQRQSLADYLVKHCAIPETVIDKVLQRLPMGIAKGKTLQQACELVETLHTFNAIAVADLTATLNFDLEIDNLCRPDKVEQLFVLIGGLSKTHYAKFLKGKAKRVEGPLNYHQARWLQHELSQLGCQITLKKRG